MLVVIAAAHDEEAAAAVAAWGDGRAVLLQPRDLSQPGWSLVPGKAGGSFVAAGQTIAVEAISGVLTRRLAVYPQELDHVTPEDRIYVAAEMTALLTWWLGTLAAPVLNRPGGGALCGPGFRTEQWLALAAALGMAVVPIARAVPGPLPPAAPPAAEVVVVAGTVVGMVSSALAKRACQLARAAGAALLWAGFDDPGRRGRLVTAHAMPRLAPPLIEALARYAGHS